MDRRWMFGWTLAASLGCGDDTAPVAGSSESSSSETGDATTLTSASTTVQPSTTLADDSSSGTTDAPTTDPTSTTVDPDSGDENVSTGELPQPFSEPVELPLPGGMIPLALAMADFDGDGALDLLVTGTDAGLVVGVTLLGDGDGGFATPVDAGVTACSAFPIVGAIDDDGRADLFFGTCSGAGVFYLGDGDGTFSATTVLDPWTGPPVRSSRFVDHDDDGDDDLLLLTVDEVGLAQLHLARHGDEDTWPVTSSDVVLARRSDFEPNGVSLARIDADAGPDALLLDVDASLAFMLADPLAGHGDATSVQLDIAPSSVLALDLQDDGLDELLAVSRTELSLQLVRNEGDGELVVDLPVADLSDAPLEAVAARFDGDDTVDLALLNATTPQIVMFAGDGSGGFTEGPSVELPATALRLLTADLNVDGAPDLVAATFAAGSVTILLAN